LTAPSDEPAEEPKSGVPAQPKQVNASNTPTIRRNNVFPEKFFILNIPLKKLQTQPTGRA
jgi:hypothetical protein